MNNSLQNDSLPNDSRTALVLGGGGAAGNAWLIGVLAGLFEAGLDVTRADLTVGTSAGSTAAAQISGASPTDLLADIFGAASPQRAVAADLSRGPSPMRPTRTHLETTNDIIAAAEDGPDMRRKMGAWALDMATQSGSPAQLQWRATVASRLPNHSWPNRRLLITAVDADTGVPLVFDRHSGIELVDAVAASCAGGFAYTIGDRRYFDGGYRFNAENADLASGYDRVLVLSPFGGRTRLPLAWGWDLASQIGELRAHGSRDETIFPDRAALEAFGDNMMNLSTREPAARAGRDQGKVHAERLADFWS